MARELSAEQQKQLMTQYQQLREQIDHNYSRISQLTTDRNEHDLVLSQLRRLESHRRCWHQIGAVLAEKSVADVLPALTHTRDKMAQSIQQLTDNVEQLERSADQLQKKYSIRQVGPSASRS
ncbi:putative prefoldin subunit 2 [Gracilariopsis chorda]|uniref:Putative prefoldin subunit 2 n=1 Tax=Gracilariopsis chorda TaxID=448386 RepID=A0A2V3J3V0_9FLOR|nr:putative prefoldin subunit 2 [Gracilariopsis chorda]|eukprot:PXF49136.1 putative prefoldin subunit 2 [Gracilariopsis chorda]